MLIATGEREAPRKALLEKRRGSSHHPQEAHKIAPGHLGPLSHGGASGESFLPPVFRRQPTKQIVVRERFCCLLWNPQGDRVSLDLYRVSGRSPSASAMLTFSS